MIEMSDVIFSAFLLHLEEVIRAEVHAEIEEAERRNAEPLRAHLQRTRNQPSWQEREQARQALQEQRARELNPRQQDLRESA